MPIPAASLGWNDVPTGCAPAGVPDRGLAVTEEAGSIRGYAFGNTSLDLDKRELRVDGRTVHLEPQVFDVLAYLVLHPDRIVGKSELLDEVWGSQFVTEATLTSRIKSARRALGDDGVRQQMIRTERGHGYRFVAAVTELDRAGSAGPPLAQPTSTVRPLPLARGSLIGRSANLDDIQALFGRHRLVTITGPGGAGKSTLGLAVARRWRAGPDAEVLLAELAPVRDRSSAIRAVAESAGVQGVGAGDLAELAAIVGRRPVLLVLDNCEHLLDIAAEFVDLVLDAGAEARVLATSREPLRLDGEAIHRIGSLGRDAPRLFVERAVAVVGDDAPAVGDPRVGTLCEHLDGLPLAIELAAAQLDHLDLNDLIARLDDRLGLLVGGRPRAGHRHSTLTATIEWSYQLLAEPNRGLFDALGVFPAGFDLAEVQSLRPELDLVTITNLVGDMVAKSLVVRSAGGRYRLLETIRLFAAGRLDGSGQKVELVERLRCHVVARATRLSRVRSWLSAPLAARNRDDIENVRLAFTASLDREDVSAAIDIAIGMSLLWRNSVSFEEGRRWIAQLADRELAPRDQLWWLVLQADIGLGAGDPRRMVEVTDAAIELGPAADDPAGVVVAMVYRGMVQLVRPSDAVERLDRASERARQLHEPALDRLARAVRVVALLQLGRRSEVEAELRAIATGDDTNDYDHYISLWASWVVALADLDGPRLRRIQDTQLESLRASGLLDNWLTMFCDALTMIGEGREYLPQLRRARRRAEAEGRHADADCVLALGLAAAYAGDPVRAAELVGASGGALFHDTANFVHHLVVRDQVVRPRLNPDTFAAAMARGSKWSIERILFDHELRGERRS